MKRTQYCLIFVIALFVLLPVYAGAEDVPAIVPTNWLEANLSNPKLVVLDIRPVEDYRKGHIPGAVSAFYGTWAYSRGEKRTEVPYQDDLFEAIGDAGIRPDSQVVVACDMSHCYYQVQAARVVCTLLYGGLGNVGILDGGYDKWVREKRSISTKAVQPVKTVYKGTLNRKMLAERDYVKSRLGKAAFVDVREPSLHKGEKKQAFVERSGHIPGSINLPASAAFAKAGTFKKKEALKAIAREAVGDDLKREIITYCDAGKCCPTWAFLFTQVLGYENVKLYDGGMEEWSRKNGLPMAK